VALWAVTVTSFSPPLSNGALIYKQRKREKKKTEKGQWVVRFHSSSADLFYVKKIL
jgi:hypothetical protein